MKSLCDSCEKFRSYSSSRMGRRDFAAVVWSLVRRVYCMYELIGVFIASANGALFLRHFLSPYAYEIARIVSC